MVLMAAQALYLSATQVPMALANVQAARRHLVEGTTSTPSLVLELSR
jgi:hypothetical protein